MPERKISKRENHQTQVALELLDAVNFDLNDAVERSGALLVGLSVKFGEVDCLMTLRGVLSGKRMICFVGAPDLSSCFRKAVSAGYSDGLAWKEDRFANGQS